MKNYDLRIGSMQHRFHESTAKIRMIGGGFGNGKTTAAVIEALETARMYPGSSILLARSTYPKLNDTLRKECLKWCPGDWVKRRPIKDDNTLILKNGTMIYFRYISQQGKKNEDGTTTSNLLSATYDLIVVDQIEDPEIAYKDFLDLMGRLRGDTRCIEPSARFPRTGPRRMVITCNPTRNWVYKKIVKPLHLYARTGRKHEDLIVDPRSGECCIELFEAATYENKALPEDYIIGLEATYKGQMRDRYLLGKWAAYEGLVYPDFDNATHILDEPTIISYLKKQQGAATLTLLEGYDYGLSSPSCYLYGCVDMYGNVILLDGYHKREASLQLQSALIQSIRDRWKWLGMPQKPILADPQIFRRGANSGKVVGRTVAGMFQEDYGIAMCRGNNDVTNGITKVNAYMVTDELHRNPFTKNWGSPRLFVSEKLDFWETEVVDYFWDKNTDGDYVDKPRKKNDHAMDATKYLFSHRPLPASLAKTRETVLVIPTTWAEREIDQGTRGHRYG